MSVQQHVSERGHTVTFRGGEDIISQEDFSAYWDVIASAFTVYLDREVIRKGLWKDYPAEDQFNQIKVKADRIVRSLERIRELRIDGDRRVIPVHETVAILEQNVLEELYDVINYAVFGGRKVEGNV